METDPINLESLLAPLDSGEQGAGSDLREDYSAASSYQKLRDARASARAEERARDADGDSDAPEASGWRDIYAIGQKALATQSKDIEIAAWLTEALVRMQGLQGVSSGARLLAGLCDGFWDSLYPRPDEDGLEVRASPIGGLSGSSADGTIMQPLRRLSLFRRTDGTSVGLYQWEQAEQLAALDQEKREAKYAEGGLDIRTLEVEAKVDKAYLTGVGQATAQAIEAWAALDQALDRHFGSEAPSIRKVGALLDRMYEVIGRLGGIPSATGESDPAPVDPAASGSGATSTAAAGSPAGAMTRESALRDLDRIAEYFRRTEPHSPLSYTLEEAVRRGNMSLLELLAEVLPDAEARSAMMQRLGMRPPDSSGY
jgi:type VI secretion system protein ImpA